MLVEVFAGKSGQGFGNLKPPGRLTPGTIDDQGSPKPSNTPCQ
jgi:hypothetical protein